MLTWPLPRSPREHPKDSKGIGGGHEDFGGWGSFVAGAVGRRRPERRNHDRRAQ